MPAEGRNPRWRLSNKKYSCLWAAILDFRFQLASHNIVTSFVNTRTTTITSYLKRRRCVNWRMWVYAVRIVVCIMNFIENVLEIICSVCLKFFGYLLRIYEVLFNPSMARGLVKLPPRPIFWLPFPNRIELTGMFKWLFLNMVRLQSGTIMSSILSLRNPRWRLNMAVIFWKTVKKQ